MKINVKPIGGKGDLFDIGAIKDALIDGLDSAAEKVQKDFDSSASTFEEKPDFTPSTVALGRQIDVYTTDENYSRISEGTSTHTIYAKLGGWLVFMAGSKPKTKPGRLKAGAGEKGTELVFAKKVRVAGIKPRLFDVLVTDKNKSTVAKKVQKLLNKAYKK